MDDVTEFNMLLLSLDCSQNDSCLTDFLTEGKRVFHVLILYLVCSGNGDMSGLISFGQASTYLPCHRYYVNVLVFVRLYVRIALAHPFKTVWFCVIATVRIGVTPTICIGVSIALAHFFTIL